jgi:hypothetical protein
MIRFCEKTGCAAHAEAFYMVRGAISGNETRKKALCEACAEKLKKDGNTEVEVELKGDE